jgi:hypothetical protein
MAQQAGTTSDEDALEGGVDGAALRCATARRHGWRPARRCGAQLHAVMGGGQRGAAVRYCMPSREPAGVAAVRHCTKTRSGLGNGEPWCGGVALCGCGAL